MSEILGHDANGRPLRAGDRAVITRTATTKSYLVGEEVVVQGHNLAPLTDRETPEVHVSWPDHPRGADIWCHWLRRIDDRTDHQPSEYTFDSLMDHLKSGVPA